LLVCSIWGSQSGLCLPPAFLLVSRSTYPSTLKMEAMFVSEKSVRFQRTTRCCIAEDTTPNSLLLSAIFDPMVIKINDRKKCHSVGDRPVVWSSGQSSWLQIQKSWVQFPATPSFLRRSRCGTGSTQPRDYNWVATWMNK
jgi:hypothetical protein